MKHDDVEVIKAHLIKMVNSLTSALGDAKQLQEILDARQRRGEYARRSDSVPAGLIDDGRFTVRWNGAECDLGATVLFRLFRRLAESPNDYVSVACLLEEVWIRDDRTEAAVRSAVRSLRRKLEDAGMADLAESIQGQPRNYRLVLSDRARKKT